MRHIQLIGKPRRLVSLGDRFDCFFHTETVRRCIFLPLTPCYSPSKIGPAEKNKIVESLTLSIEILIKLLGSQPHLVTVLSRVLEQSSTFYAGKMHFLINRYCM